MGQIANPTITLHKWGTLQGNAAYKPFSQTEKLSK